MPAAPQTDPQDFFTLRLGISLDAILAPISADKPCGESLRNDPVYAQILNARCGDDASLPQGAWQHDLKNADWPLVASLCAKNLATRSKDLQLIAWLLEAMIHQHGFAALAPCLSLLDETCERFWDGLYPRFTDGDLDYRTNIFTWINAKLLPTLRQVPITESYGGQRFSWSDWEAASRNTQLASRAPDEILEGANYAEITAALAMTDGATCQTQHAELAAALTTLDQLESQLDAGFGSEAPNLGALRTLVLSIYSFLSGELVRRAI